MRMSEQEAWDLDDLLTRTDPELMPNGTGFLSRREAGLMGMDSLSVDDQSGIGTEPSCPEIMVRKRIAAAVQG